MKVQVALPDGETLSFPRVRDYFRWERMRDHHAEAEALFRLQDWVRGEHCISHIRGTGVTLYTLDVDPTYDHHRLLLNLAHRHGVQWENRLMRWRWRLESGQAGLLMEMLQDGRRG